MGKRKRASNGAPGNRKRQAAKDDETEGGDGLDVRKLKNEVIEKGIERMENIQTLLKAMSPESLELGQMRILIHALRESFAALEDHFECAQNAAGVIDSEEALVMTWLVARRNTYLEALSNYVLREDSALSKLALAVLLTCAARWNLFHAALQGIVEYVLTDTDLEEEDSVINHLGGYLREFDDVRLSVLNLVESFCKKYRKGSRNDEERVASRCLRLLDSVKMPKSVDEPVQLLQNKHKFAFREKAENLGGKSSYYKQERKAFGECWLNVLSMKLPDESVDRVLSDLPEEVIPNMPEPIRLSDFLLSAYNRGGISAVVSLESLWILINVHGLDYPLFYEKLYGVLSPDLFLTRDRQKFMTLVPKFLSSGYIPVYLVAAFLKRLLRRALWAPPQGALWCMRVALELIQRHPSVVVLVHNPETRAQRVVVNFSLPTTPAEEQIHGTQLSEDVFDDDTVDPKKSNADRSSLWELEALKHHYCPAVARMYHSFEKDSRSKKAPKDLTLPGKIEDYASISFADLFEAELRRKAKECPLAYAAPQRVLDTSNLVQW
mmetsp:Transcript_10821/g.15611  ORF Transcript_10821/g.15611 Transcript_10821/m.15611 type:complete len:551 (-) Transcript_10821:750-2402(-)